MLARRGVLGLGLAAVASASLGSIAHAAPALLTPAAPRRVALHNLHTGEQLQAVYFDQGRYVPDALSAVNHVLRDHRNGQVHSIDPRLLDLLDQVASRTDTRDPFQVLSGYRSPATNAMLHARSEEVAVHSLHTQGMAIDIRLQDGALPHLHDAALQLGLGGVGYYPTSNFVHVDVGRVRRWQGS
jgi:uncharacterized protein YcbK (DUF882 family)